MLFFCSEGISPGPPNKILELPGPPGGVPRASAGAFISIIISAPADSIYDKKRSGLSSYQPVIMELPPREIFKNDKKQSGLSSYHLVIMELPPRETRGFLV